MYMTDFLLFGRLNLPNVLISRAKKNFDSNFSSPCFDVPKRQIALPVWYKIARSTMIQETENDCDVISRLQASRKTDFSDIFLFSYKQRTIVPFLSELICSH